MSSFYKKNLEALSKKYPAIAHKIETLTQTSIKLIYEENGDANLTFIGKSGKEEKLYLSSEPKIHSSKIMRALKLKYQNPKILIFNGAGLAYHILSYAQDPNPETLFILIFEPSLEIFKQAMSISDLSPIILSERVFFIIGSNEEENQNRLYHLFNNPLLLRYSNAIEYVDFRENVDLWEKDYSQFKEWVSKNIQLNFISHTPSYFQQYQKYENYFSNYLNCLKLPNVNQLKNAFLGKVGVIINSGATLKENLNALQSIQDKAILIASPKALPLLTKEKIRIDFCLNISSDPQESKLLKEYAQKINFSLIGTPSIDPLCYETHKGKTFVLYAYSRELSWFPTSNYFIGSANYFIEAAFQLLKEWGCSSIVLTGENFLEKISSHQSLSKACDTALETEENNINSYMSVFDKASTQSTSTSSTQHFYGHAFDYLGNQQEVDLLNIKQLREIEKNCLSSYSGIFIHLLSGNKGIKIGNAKEMNQDEFLKSDILFSDEINKKIITEKLSLPYFENTEEIKKLILEKCKLALIVIEDTIEDFENYALEIKRHIFSGWSLVQDEKMEKGYQHFKDYFIRFMERHRLDPQKNSSIPIYTSLIKPIIEGNELVTLSEYFNHYENENRNVTAMYIKMGYVYNYCQASSFWLRQLKKCVQKYLNTHS